MVVIPGAPPRTGRQPVRTITIAARSRVGAAVARACLRAPAHLAQGGSATSTVGSDPTDRRTRVPRKTSTGLAVLARYQTCPARGTAWRSRIRKARCRAIAIAAHPGRNTVDRMQRQHPVSMRPARTLLLRRASRVVRTRWSSGRRRHLCSRRTAGFGLLAHVHHSNRRRPPAT